MGAQIFETTRKTLDLFKNYPKIARYVSLYHPDTQGPMDVCELLWGSRLFLDIYDQPELVHALLKLITATYTRFLRRWFALVSGAPYSPQPSQRFAPHWALLHRGVIMLRDDSAMNFSPRMFEQFIEPYDQQLLDEFNGGAVHFCGKGSHYIRRMGQMRGVYGIQLTQPEYNDMEHIYQHTVDKGIPLLALEPREAERTLAEGRSLHGLVHCWQPLKELQ